MTPLQKATREYEDACHAVDAAVADRDIAEANASQAFSGRSSRSKDHAATQFLAARRDLERLRDVKAKAATALKAAQADSK